PTALPRARAWSPPATARARAPRSAPPPRARPRAAPSPPAPAPLHRSWRAPSSQALAPDCQRELLARQAQSRIGGVERNAERPRRIELRAPGVEGHEHVVAQVLEVALGGAQAPQGVPYVIELRFVDRAKIGRRGRRVRRLRALDRFLHTRVLGRALPIRHRN